MSGNTTTSGNKRWLWITLAATLTAAAWLSLQDDSSSDAADAGITLNTSRKASSIRQTPQASRDGPPADYASAPVQGAPSGLVRPLISSEPRPLFSSASTAAAISSEAAAAPEMPALPFTYAGKLMEDGKYTVFLLTPQRSLAVQRGDVLESAWRVKEIRPPRMTFYYLPLKLETSMDIGSAMENASAMDAGSTSNGSALAEQSALDTSPSRLVLPKPQAHTPAKSANSAEQPNNEQKSDKPWESPPHMANHPAADTTFGERN